MDPAIISCPGLAALSGCAKVIEAPSPSLVHSCFARQKLIGEEAIDPGTIALVASQSMVRDYRRADGHPIIEEATPADYVYFILSGAVEVEKRTGTHRTVLLDTLVEGDMFGEIAAMRDCLRTTQVRPKEDTTCLMVPRDVFRSYLEKNPSAYAVLDALIRERLHEIYATEPGIPNENSLPCLASLRILLMSAARSCRMSLPDFLETKFGKSHRIVDLFSGSSAPAARWLSSLGFSVEAVDMKAPEDGGFPWYIQAAAEDLGVIPDGTVDIFLVVNYLQDDHVERSGNWYRPYDPGFFQNVAEQIERKLCRGGSLYLVTGDGAKEVTPFLEARGLKRAQLLPGLYEFKKP